MIAGRAKLTVFCAFEGELFHEAGDQAAQRATSIWDRGGHGTVFFFSFLFFGACDPSREQDVA
jgi:hypothetical protein